MLWCSSMGRISLWEGESAEALLEDHLLARLVQHSNVTLWCCYATAPGTLGYTRHLLGLVSWVHK